jgi:hypothetical protein
MKQFELDISDPKKSTIKTPTMWKSGRTGTIIAAEATTIISEEKFYFHASDWWNGEGMDLTITGKDCNHHISLPSEAWAVIASVIPEIIGNPAAWLENTEE